MPPNIRQSNSKWESGNEPTGTNSGVLRNGALTEAKSFEMDRVPNSISTENILKTPVLKNRDSLPKVPAKKVPTRNPIFRMNTVQMSWANRCRITGGCIATVLPDDESKRYK